MSSSMFLDFSLPIHGFSIIVTSALGSFILIETTGFGDDTPLLSLLTSVFCELAGLGSKLTSIRTSGY